MSARAFTLTEPNADGKPALTIDVARDGRIIEYLPGAPEADRVATIRLHDDESIRQIQSGQVLFQRRTSDGELVQTAPGGIAQQDLHCHFTADAELHCIHDDGKHALTFAIHGDRIMAAGDSRTLWKIEPAPTTIEQRRRALFMFAMDFIELDTNSHDGDTGTGS